MPTTRTKVKRKLVREFVPSAAVRLAATDMTHRHGTHLALNPGLPSFWEERHTALAPSALRAAPTCDTQGMPTDAQNLDADGHQSVVVRLGLGHTGDQALYVRVSPNAASEMRELMEAHGVFSGEIMEFSAGTELIIYAGSIAGGLGGLAAVLTAYFNRNQNKSINFSYGEDTVELRGYSEDAVNRLVGLTLEILREEQLARDREWKRIMGRDDDGGSAK